MPASRTIQQQLDILHNEFILSGYIEPLRFLENKWIQINKRLKKYVKIWRENKILLRKKRNERS